MADYVIDNLVNPKSKAELETLIKRLQEASIIANKIVIETSNIKTLKDLANAQEAYNKSLKSQEFEQKRLDALTQKMAIDAQKEIDRRNTLQEKAHREELKRINAEANAQKKLADQADKTAQARNKNLTKLRESDPGSINKLSAANAILQERLRGVNQTTADGAIKADRLRGAIDRNHTKIKEMSPDVTKQAMNVGNYGSVWDKVGGTFQKVGGFFMGFTALFGAGSIAMSAYMRTVSALDSTLDEFEAMMEGSKQATDAFFRSIAEGDWSNLIDNMVRAYDEGKRYAGMLDLLEDKNRALSITNAQTDAEISRLKAFARDRSNDLEERRKAVNQIIELEKKKLTDTKAIRDQELDNELKNASSQSGLTTEAIKRIVSTVGYQEKINDAMDVYNKLMSQSVKYEVDRRSGLMVKTPDMVKYNALLRQESKETQMNIFYALRYNDIAKDKRDLIATALKAQYGAEKEYTEGIGGLSRLRNSLENDLLKQDDNRVKQKVKNTDDLKKLESDSLQWFMYINGQRQKDIEDQLSQENISIEKQIELNQKLATEKIKALEKQRDFDLKYASSPVEKSRIGQKFDIEFANVVAEQQAKNEKIVADAKKKARDKELTDIEYQIEKETQLAEIKRDKAIEANANEYLNKTITYEEYEKNKAKIEEQYAKDHLQMVIDMTAKEIAILEKRPDLTEEERKKLEKLKADLAKMNADLATQGIKENKSIWDADHLQEYYDKAKEITDAVGGLFDALTAKKIANLEAEQEKSEEVKNGELERVQKLLDDGTISQANADKQKEKIEKRAEARQRDIEKRKAKLEYDNAMWKWKQSLLQIALDTAMAIVKLPASGGLLGLAAIPLIIATGAISMATAIASKPQPPKYKKGTSYHPGGFATVGDGGRELLRMPDGSTYLANDEMTFNAPRGMKVLKNSDTEKVLSEAKGYKIQPIDIDSLVSETKTTNKLLKNIANKPTINRIFVTDNSRYNQFKA